MTITVWQGLLCFCFVFFFPNVLYLILGLLFCRSRSDRWHVFGVCCLSMCALVPGKFVSSHCRQPCDIAQCGNWTCPNYSNKRK